MRSLSCVQLFATPWTVAHQASLSMKFSRHEYWSGLPFPSSGNLPNPGIESGSSTLQANALLSELLGKPWCILTINKFTSGRRNKNQLSLSRLISRDPEMHFLIMHSLILEGIWAWVQAENYDLHTISPLAKFLLELIQKDYSLGTLRQLLNCSLLLLKVFMHLNY